MEHPKEVTAAVSGLIAAITRSKGLKPFKDGTHPLHGLATACNEYLEEAFKYQDDKF